MTSSKETRPYGHWSSPVTTDLVAGKTLQFGSVQSAKGYLYWTESRPHEAGRSVIMRSDLDGSPEEILPSPFAARSRIHEYGGGEFSVSGEDVYFVNADDQDIYKVNSGQTPERITNTPDTRFSDIAADQRFNRLIAVAETHNKGAHHPENDLVSISSGGVISPVASEQDFYASPRVSPDGNQLAWIAWNLPDMPWDSAGLYIADINEDGSLSVPRLIAGGYEAAIFQPEWGPDGRLYFISDEAGIGALYAFDGEVAESIYTSNAELARPLWGLGARSYAFMQDGSIIAAGLKEGNLDLLQINPEDGTSTQIPGPLKSLDGVVNVNGQICGVGATDFTPPAIITLNPETTELKTIRPSAELDIGNDNISAGQVLRFPSSVPEEDIYGVFYPPANSAFKGPEADKPPLIILVHGGPTGYAARGFKMKIQYWTSRGFAVFDLDYSGSYGYGRDYMERLNGNWGLRDVQDVDSALNYLSSQNLVNPEALFISGGSAGGFTVLLSLAELDQFAGGACSYGVADLVHLQATTHKFEGGYLFRLMGVTPPESWPEDLENYDKTVFTERSPVSKAHKISSPVIFFQGLEDKVVPPEQTRSMVASLGKEGGSVISHEFAGEGHGFRMTDTIKKVLDEEYQFYLNILDS